MDTSKKRVKSFWKAIFLVAPILFLSFAAVHTIFAASVDFNPEADTYIYQSNPTTQYGKATSIAVGGSPYRRDLFFRFAINGLPAGCTVTDARLILVAANGSTAAGGGGTIRKFAPAVEQWSETQPTWNSPLAGNDASGDLCTIGPVSQGKTYTFTGLQNAVSGNGRVTFVIRSNQEDGAAYYSKEYGTASQRPILRVTYSPGQTNKAPVVNAGADQTITLPALANLSGTMSDDGLPNPPGKATTAWTKISGPGTVAFGDSAALTTSAAFSQSGTYVLRLTADDSLLKASDDLTLTVLSAPTAPIISAHPADQTVTENQTASFSVAASGSEPLSFQWQRNGANIAGATGPVYTTPPAVLADHGTAFRCSVKNSAGTVFSSAAVLTVQAMPDIPRFGIFEKTFTLDAYYSNPYTQVSATATFSAPDGSTHRNPLFWSGGKTWKFRFSPHIAGTWSWSLYSNDASLNGSSGSFHVVSSTLRGGIQPNPSYPYHFAYEDGSPFFFLGDTQWAGFGSKAAENLNASTFLHYLDLRSKQGITYIHSSLMDPGTNEGGDIFFNVSAEIINPAYFQEVDSRIQNMNARGITAGIVLAWANSSPVDGQTPPSWESFSSEAARLRYARYVTSRYSAYNVVFIVSGEWNETGTKEMYLAIGDEILNNDPHRRMIGIHSNDSVEEFAAEPWMSFGDYQQIYTDLHSSILHARDHNKPVVNSEYAYYLRDMDGNGTVDKPNSATLADIRNASYDIVMAGGHLVTGWGTTYYGGMRDPGPFNPDDPRNGDWEEDIQHLRALFTGLEWWKLEPNDALLSGSGTHYCLAEIGRQYLLYVRNSREPLSLSLGGAAAANFQVHRFDPRTGTYTILFNYSGAGPIALTPPDNQDWVFLLTNTGEPVNEAPRVNAGPDQTVEFPKAANLAGTVSDNGGTFTAIWSKINGPGTVTFGDPSALITTATFSQPGTYILRLTAEDGVFQSSDDIKITSGAGTPVTVDFQVEADTYIYQSYPTTQYGKATSVAVGGSPNRRDLFFRFAINGLPAGCTVTDARLILVAANASTAAGGGGTIRKFAPAVEQWSETQPTWNSPLAGSDASGDLCTIGPVSQGKTYTFTGLQNAVSGNGRVTFVIRSNQEDGAAYYSKEYGTASQRPILRITCNP